MSKAATNIGCPHCEASTVELTANTSGDFSDSSRLKGTAYNCGNCGDEFEVYFY
ncbi:hypothetical protein [Halorussus halophilus]|uniref:hypothetical protein n=1 Tax=Halorussus halophilus TaxID=2650975 RepID=UPI00178803B2|nr:hypothetical protein [Halorussus halophilus]